MRFSSCAVVGLAVALWQLQDAPEVLKAMEDENKMSGVTQNRPVRVT